MSKSDPPTPLHPAIRDRSGERMPEDQMLRLLATAVRDAHESVLITDTELDEPGPRILFVNPAFTRVTGYEPDEVLGNTPRILQGPKTDRSMLKRLRAAVEATGRFSATAVNYRKNGEEYIVEWDIAPVTDEQGNHTHYVSIQRDVTDRKRAEQKLRQTATDLEQAMAAAAEARRHAELANETKSRFVANLSHEIRTPMTAIMGFARVLRDELQANPAATANVDQILSSGEHLLSLMNDILDLSRVESGKLSIEPEPFDIEDLLREVAKLHRPTAEKKNLTLELIVENRMPPRVMLDRHRTRQILSNLLSNAIKFTDQGGVRLRARHDSDAGRLTLDVEDDGRGIPLDQQDQVFEAFHQVGSSDVERHHGTGLGLAITRHLARAMNGDVQLDSRPGDGSRFSVTLPAIFLRNGNSGRASVPAPEHVDPPAATRPRISLSGLEILAVDDHEANRLLLKHVLQQAGAEVRLAEDGETAVSSFAETPVDVVILDVQMPGIDGYEAVRRIRRLPGGDRVPILMLTAFAMDSDREKSLDAGADSYLSKPFKPAELLQTVARLSRRENVSASRRATASPGGDELATLRREFLDHHLERLESYLKELPDSDTLSTWAHQLAGAAGSFGYPGITERARGIERKLDTGAARTTVTDRLNDVLTQLEQARKETGR